MLTFWGWFICLVGLCLLSWFVGLGCWFWVFDLGVWVLVVLGWFVWLSVWTLDVAELDPLIVNVITGWGCILWCFVVLLCVLFVGLFLFCW